MMHGMLGDDMITFHPLKLCLFYRTSFAVSTVLIKDPFSSSTISLQVQGTIGKFGTDSNGALCNYFSSPKLFAFLFSFIFFINDIIHDIQHGSFIF
jgi:hypothetical protein